MTSRLVPAGFSPLFDLSQTAINCEAPRPLSVAGSLGIDRSLFDIRLSSAMPPDVVRGMATGFSPVPCRVMHRVTPILCHRLSIPLNTSRSFVICFSFKLQRKFSDRLILRLSRARLYDASIRVLFLSLSYPNLVQTSLSP